MQIICKICTPNKEVACICLENRKIPDRRTIIVRVLAICRCVSLALCTCRHFAFFIIIFLFTARMFAEKRVFNSYQCIILYIVFISNVEALASFRPQKKQNPEFGVT